MQKGFTLVELLIVIAILAVLGVAVVVVLNPAELLRQARDSTRIADLSAVNSALALYLTDVTSPNLTGAGLPATTSRCTSATSTYGEPFSFACATVASTTVDNTGWVSVDFRAMTGGSPLGKLPKDPTDSGAYFYAYSGNNPANQFELDGRLESTKYRDQMTKDGGNKNTCTTGASYTDTTCYYETGSRLDM